MCMHVGMCVCVHVCAQVLFLCLPFVIGFGMVEADYFVINVETLNSVDKCSVCCAGMVN